MNQNQYSYWKELAMSEDYRTMWTDLGLDLAAHDSLLSVLGQASVIFGGRYRLHRRCGQKPMHGCISGWKIGAKDIDFRKPAIHWRGWGSTVGIGNQMLPRKLKNKMETMNRLKCSYSVRKQQYHWSRNIFGRQPVTSAGNQGVRQKQRIENPFSSVCLLGSLFYKKGKK